MIYYNTYNEHFTNKKQKKVNNEFFFKPNKDKDKEFNEVNTYTNIKLENIKCNIKKKLFILNETIMSDKMTKIKKKNIKKFFFILLIEYYSIINQIKIDLNLLHHQIFSLIIFCNIMSILNDDDIINIIKSFDKTTMEYNIRFEKCNILYSDIIPTKELINFIKFIANIYNFKSLNNDEINLNDPNIQKELIENVLLLISNSIYTKQLVDILINNITNLDYDNLICLMNIKTDNYNELNIPDFNNEMTKNININDNVFFLERIKKIEKIFNNYNHTLSNFIQLIITIFNNIINSQNIYDDKIIKLKKLKNNMYFLLLDNNFINKKCLNHYQKYNNKDIQHIVSELQYNAKEKDLLEIINILKKKKNKKYVKIINILNDVVKLKKKKT